jgi:hypothetical protein
LTDKGLQHFTQIIRRGVDGLSNFSGPVKALLGIPGKHHGSFEGMKGGLADHD